MIVTVGNLTKKSSFTNDYTSIIFAGHVLLVFYCIIFILGFLGK